MAKTDIFAFGRECDTKIKGKIEKAGSIHNPAGSGAPATFSPSLYKAVKRYAQIEFSVADGAIGYDENGNTIAELPSDEDSSDLVVITTTNNVLAGSYNHISGTLKPYTIGRGKRYGTAIVFAMMPILMENVEFNNDYHSIKEDILKDENDISDFESYERIIGRMCDNFYRRFTKDNLVNIPGTGNLTKLTMVSLESGTYSPADVIIGEEFHIFSDGEAKTASVSGGKSSISKEDFLKNYVLDNSKEYTEDEKTLLFHLDNNYIIPDEAVKVAERVKKSSTFKEPMRNFYIFGPAGTGKTQLSNAVSAALGLPKVTFTCGPDTDKFDLIGQMIPNTGKKERDINITVDDIIFDFENAYRELTGESEIPLGYTKEECIELYISKMQESEAPDFYFQESPIVRAMKNGYLVEIQEITVCKPTALEYLNSLLENGGEITLPTGEHICRHKNTVVIATANTMYSGNREVNQAIKSRMACSYEMELPNKDVIIDRIVAKSELSDRDIISTMVDIGNAIDKHCESLDMKGMVGMRELINWANDYVISGDAFTSCIDTIIKKIGSDKEFHNELISSFLEPSAFA